ncbi:MAG: hypothetical protein P4L63_00115 [Candidatus Pacebacteria bacterium]|nr:hypothetical protein [Candidatus Paceibacterota bacterium]
MDPESKKLLENIYSLEYENNKILRSMKRSMVWGQIMSVVYWLIIIGASIGAFYFLQPYINKIMNLYNSVSGVEQTINPNQ